MTDTTTVDQEICESCQRPLKDARNFAELRTERDDLKSKLETANEKLMQRTIKDAGFDPELGIVKRLAREYEGDGADVEAFKAFAVAEGLQPTATSAETAPGQRSDTEQQLDTLQGKGDRLREASTQQTPATDLHQEIADLEHAGKWAEAGRLKRQLQRDAATKAG